MFKGKFKIIPVDDKSIGLLGVLDLNDLHTDDCIKLITHDGEELTAPIDILYVIGSRITADTPNDIDRPKLQAQWRRVRTACVGQPICAIIRKAYLQNNNPDDIKSVSPLQKNLMDLIFKYAQEHIH